MARYTENVDIVKGEKRRRLQKHSYVTTIQITGHYFVKHLKKWAVLIIGNSKQHLIPTYQPKGAEGEYKSARKKNSTVAGDSVKRSGQTVQNKNQHKRPQKGRY